MHALSSLSNMAAILMSALHSLIEVVRSASDSSIAISWVVYEKVRLHVFHRLRVSNIRNKLDIGELFHVVGKENIADTGTRPDVLKVEDILPGSEWLTGKDWMTKPVDDAVEMGVLKNVDDIKLDNDAKKLLREGIMLDSSLNSVSADLKQSLSNKVVEREDYSGYVVPPLKWRFPRFVRTVAYVLLAVRKFKLKMVTARQRKGLSVSDGSTPESLSIPAPKFSVFNVSTDSTLSSTSSMSALFKVSYVRVSTVNGVKVVRLTDGMLSLSLEYIYRKTTAEVIKFNDKKYVDKIGEMCDGILYCKSRIEESQDLRAVGGLEDIIDLQSFTGVNFRVPVIDRYSPIAVSLAYHLHFEVVKHRGPETTHRMSLQYANILGGRSLFKLIRDECLFCQKLLLKYT